jgi:hypothetical protein
MTSGAIRLPPPSRPSKKQGNFGRLTPRRSRQQEMVETANYQREEEEEDNTDTLPHNLTSSMDLLATLTASNAPDAPLSPPRSMFDFLLDTGTSDPSVLSPREASDPSSPASAYQVPASFQLNHRPHNSRYISGSGGGGSGGLKRPRSVSEKENALNITDTVAQLFSGSPKASAGGGKDFSQENCNELVSYDWTVNVDQLTPKKQAKHFWDVCYGSMDTFGTRISTKFQDSWSARRLPPPKGWYVKSRMDVVSILGPMCWSTTILYYCAYPLTLFRVFFHSLSTGAKKRQRLTFAADKGASTYDPMLSPVSQPPARDTFSTPKSSPSDDDIPRVTSSHNRTVKFGPPSAVEFEADNPVGSLTPVPDQVALRRFPVENQEEEPSKLELLQETKDNSAMLAEWDESFGVFEDDEDDDKRMGFELPAPPSRTRDRRSSGYFSPSDGSTTLLDYPSDDDNMLINTSVTSHDDSVLDLPMLESLSVQSPPLEVSLQSVNRSGAASLAPKDLDEKSPDDVREWHDSGSLGRCVNQVRILVLQWRTCMGCAQKRLTRAG